MSTQISSELMGMLYVMDEPSIGLHPRDSGRVIETMKMLRDIGNSKSILLIWDRRVETKVDISLLRGRRNRWLR